MSWDSIGAIGEIVGALASQLQDPDLAQIWIASLEGLEALSVMDHFRLVVYLTTVLRSYESAYFQWRNGRLDDETWLALMAVARDA